VSGAEDLLEQRLVVGRALEVDQRLFDALKELVDLGQEQRLVVGGQIKLELGHDVRLAAGVEFESIIGFRP
jgi:hypothetical protein